MRTLSGDITGKRFGNLVVLRKTDKIKSRSPVWECQCDCGSLKETTFSAMNRGDTLSCGCLRRKVASASSKARTKHGQMVGNKAARTYKTWQSMRKRVYYKNGPHYEMYGGRGVKVCERWDDFSNFLADMGERPLGMTLDRIDSSGDYEPSNCRWATSLQQGRNRRNTIRLTLRGETKYLREWADELGVSPSSLRRRKKLGWSDEDILTIPVKKRRLSTRPVK